MNLSTVGLLGQPNTGKSTLFNHLTNSMQHVGNWPGKTVEKKTGECRHNLLTYQLVDLPGTYSLSANSEEELITRSFIFSGKSDAIIAVIDASQLARSLYLLADFAGIAIPVVVVLNMVDVAKASGTTVDCEELARKLGVSVVPMVATKGMGFAELLNDLGATLESQSVLETAGLLKVCKKVYGESFSKLVNLLQEEAIQPRYEVWLALKLLEKDAQVSTSTKQALTKDAWGKVETILGKAKQGALQAASCKYEWIDSMVDSVVKKEAYFSQRKAFDRIATHPLWGIPLALLFISLAFVSSVLMTIPLMLSVPALISTVNAAVSELFFHIAMPNAVSSLVIEAVIPAFFMTLFMGAYVSGISLVFGFMEDVGYMARIAYVFDGVMSRIGLHGKSFMPFALCLGCNMAGITGSRVIDSWQQRLLLIGTSLVIPCSARWGVIALVSSLFFGEAAVWVILSLFFLMLFHIAGTSWIFKKVFFAKEEEPTGLIMELPPYHKPNWKTIFSYVKARIGSVFNKALKIILGVSIVVWSVSYSPGGHIEDSLIYSFGKSIEPIGALFGLEWRLFIAFIVSAMGKEAALGVIAMLFGVGGGITSFTGTMLEGALQYNQANLLNALSASVSKAGALAFIYAFFFNVPCMAAMAAVHVETRSAKWPLILTAYYMGTALLIGAAAYHIGTLIF